MRYAIIAAGEGSRLVQEGVRTPKPLVEVGGEKLIDRLIRIFLANGASQIVVICNEQMKEVSAHLTSIRQTKQIPLQFVVKSTPSSMHSMWELSRWLGDEPFVLTTVDTFFQEREFSEYVEMFRESMTTGEADGLMGVTDYVDDEKPLYVATNDQLTITGFLDSRGEGVKYVSGGIYGLSSRSLETLQRCIERGESRMRNFQRALVNDGFLLKAWPFSKVLDIDHASDVAKAEAFLGARSKRFEEMRILMIQRAERFSPNSVEKDLAILKAVAEKLRCEGHAVNIVSESTLDPEKSEFDFIFSMGREPSTLAWLKTQKSLRVINAPEGVENCTRTKLETIMKRIGTPLPPQKGSNGYWLKRGDAAAQSEDDVQFATDEAELEQKIQQFENRGIKEYTIGAHVEGDLVKFYGVEGAAFFRYYYPTNDGESKFGDEQHNGEARHFPFDVSSLQICCEQLAKAVGVCVYGGDGIVREDGSFCIIDFNDWPSFSRCRAEASEAIASLLYSGYGNI